jgi:hypothetical protein
VLVDLIDAHFPSHVLCGETWDGLQRRAVQTLLPGDYMHDEASQASSVEHARFITADKHSVFEDALHWLMVMPNGPGKAEATVFYRIACDLLAGRAGLLPQDLESGVVQTAMLKYLRCGRKGLPKFGFSCAHMALLIFLELDREAPG